jgi:phosphatidylserine decarboxylase
MVILTALRLVPKNLLSRIVGRFSRSALSRFLLPWFIGKYSINLSEAIRPDGGFATLHDLFTRHLVPGARPIAAAALVSPADGRVASSGAVAAGMMVQAKGKNYRLDELLGEAITVAETGLELAYATIYLAPPDYHRLHSPAALLVESIYAVPGTLWPVNPMSVNGVDRLFCINERVTLRCRLHDGRRLWVVLVGATIVGGIRLAFDPAYASNLAARRQVERTVYPEPIALAPGDALGHFEFGSTAILVWESSIGLPSSVLGAAVQVGAALV